MSAYAVGPRRWAVILAGGEGEGMRPFIEQWLGGHRPKQYCSFAGGRSMIEHTLRRAQGVVAPGHVVTVIDGSHRDYLRAPRELRLPGTVVEQPRNLDTGPGVFLPLTRVMQEDEGAVVAVLPSDHFIYPKGRFCALLQEAFLLAQAMPDRLLLLSAIPYRAETDYGWIRPGLVLPGKGGRLVSGFREKPDRDEAMEIYLAGGLWSTMIVVATAATLWKAGWDLEPEMMSRFEALRGRMGTPEQAEAVAAAYAGMRPVDFSQDILSRAMDRLVTLPMSGVSWCDWGRPERVLDSLKWIGRKPAFPRRLAEARART